MITPKLNTKKLPHFIFPILGLLFLGCADTYNWANIPISPAYINGNIDSTSKVDSFKIHYKQYAPNALDYEFTLSTTDFEQINTISIASLPDNIELIADGNIANVNSQIMVSKDKPSIDFSFSLERDYLTDYVLKFKAIDSRGFQSSETIVKVIAFTNLLPKAILSISKVSNSIFKFDGSESFDGDQKYGGEIKNYIFKIDGDETKEFTTDSSIINYGFPNLGTYNVSLIVIDNDAVASTPTELQTVIVN